MSDLRPGEPDPSDPSDPSDPRPRDDRGEPRVLTSSSQTVTAVDGFAYGVVGADICVFGDGVPVYILENWRGPIESDPGWLREMPSRMLHSRHAVVEFTGRAEELEALVRWRDTGPRLALRWLHGPGGQGKSRICDQLAAMSIAEGWKVVTATHGPGAVLPPPGSQDLRLGDARGLLAIVDYADRWPPSDLAWLLSNALFHQVGVPTRILMLARDMTAWMALRGSVSRTLQAGLSAQALDALPDDAGSRREMFDAARDAFAFRYDVPDPGRVEPPVALDGPEMGLTLAVHMAALVAVDAAAGGTDAAARASAADGVAGLTLYLLDREHLHWQRLYGDATRSLDEYAAPRPGIGDQRIAAPVTPNVSPYRYTTPPQTMNRVVYAAALTGPVSRGGATALLDRLRLGCELDPVLDDHAYCYPLGDTAGATTLEPLHPDRLAEDFLALTLPGHRAEYEPQDWAPAVVREIVGADGIDGFRELTSASARTITFLAAAAGRWPHVASRCLGPMLRERSDAAVNAGSSALTALACLDHADIGVDTLRAIELRFPSGSNVDLDVGMAALTQSLAEHRLAQTRDPAARAKIHHDLGVRLKAAGRVSEAAAATRAAVELLRPLYTDGPVSRRLDLMRALNNMSLCHSAVGELQEALERTREALALGEELQIDSTTGEPDAEASAVIALLLQNLGNVLSDLGRQEEALAPILESVSMRRRLYANRRISQSSLASSLMNLGSCYATLGRHEDSLAPIGEAVGILRPLARADPGAHEAGLARLLNNLGMQLARLGRLGESLDTATEAAALLRKLCDRNPAALEPGFAATLSNLGLRLSQNGRLDEALNVAFETLALSRRLAAALPAAHEPQLALSLLRVGSDLRNLGRQRDALEPTNEAIGIYRRWAAAIPGVYEEALAASLATLSATMTELGLPADSLKPTLEAIEIRRRLAARLPEAHEDDLADALTSLGVNLSLLGRYAEALESSHEAVEIRRRLVKALPGAHSKGLAMALSNYGLRLCEAGRHREALEATSQAVEITRRLAAETPGAHDMSLALYLTNLGVHLMATGCYEQSVVATREAAALRREQADWLPEAFEVDLATALTNLAYRLCTADRHAQALEPADEATRILRRYAAAEPLAHKPRLVTALTNQAVALHGTRRDEAALAAIDEAIRLGRELAEDAPEVHGPPLANALNNRGNYLRGLGCAEDALASYLAAIAVRRRLAAALPEVYDLDLARSLLNVATSFGELKRPERQLAAASESVALLRRLSGTGQGAYESDLASALNNQSMAFAAVRDRAEAVAAVSEAVLIRRDLQRRNPGIFEPILAKSLVHLSLRHAEAGRRQEALDAQQEAVDMLRRLAEQAPEAHRRDLAVALLNLSERHTGLLQIRKAVAARKEAIAISRSLPPSAG